MKLGYCQKYQARSPLRVAPVAASSVRGDHRTRLQAVAIFILDGVLLVVENAVQSLVQVGHVVAAVEIVVDKDFPVAGDVVDPAIEVMQLGKPERRAALHQTA